MIVFERHRLVLGAAIVSALATSQQVSAAALYGASEAGATGGIQNSQTVESLVANVVSSALTLIGVLFFILTIYAGVTWMLARGNEEYNKRALSTLIAAIIGLIIVIASYAITQFVFNASIGA